MGDYAFKICYSRKLPSRSWLILSQSKGFCRAFTLLDNVLNTTSVKCHKSTVAWLPQNEESCVKNLLSFFNTFEMIKKEVYSELKYNCKPITVKRGVVPTAIPLFSKDDYLTRKMSTFGQGVTSASVHLWFLFTDCLNMTVDIVYLVSNDAFFGEKLELVTKKMAKFPRINYV